MLALPVPETGVRESQLWLSRAVQLRVPSPELETVKLWGSVKAEPLLPKVRAERERAISGGGRPWSTTTGQGERVEFVFSPSPNSALR